MEGTSEKRRKTAEGKRSRRASRTSFKEARRDAPRRVFSLSFSLSSSLSHETSSTALLSQNKLLQNRLSQDMNSVRNLT